MQWFLLRIWLKHAAADLHPALKDKIIWSDAYQASCAPDRLGAALICTDTQAE